MTNEELCKRIRSGHKEYLDDLIRQNTKFVKAMANKIYASQFYANSITGLGAEDLVQEGLIKLMESVETYDETKGYIFLTYAGTNIENAILDCVRKAKATLEGHLSYDDECEWTEKRLEESIRSEEGRMDMAEQLIDPFQHKTEKVAIEHLEYMTLYEGLRDCSKRHRSLLVYHYGFLDGEEHRFEETAWHFRKTTGKIKIEHGKALRELPDKFAWYPKCINCCAECKVYKSIVKILERANVAYDGMLIDGQTACDFYSVGKSMASIKYMGLED